MTHISVSQAFFPVVGRHYLVFGLGRSGLSVARWLLENGAHVSACDDCPKQKEKAQALGISIVDKSKNLWQQSFAALIQSPGIPLSHPITQQAYSHHIPVVGDLDLYCLAYPNIKKIGITGTNGKSTTTALIAHILAHSGHICYAAGNIGVPVFDIQPTNETILVLELSSYQLESSQHLVLDYVAWTNITEDHLARHGTMEAYVAAKKRIFSGVSGEHAFIGVDDAFSAAVQQEMKGVPISVSGEILDKGLSVTSGILYENQRPLFDLRALETLQGTHNAQNIALAYGVCRAYGMTSSACWEALKTFPGLSHRQEWIATHHGVRFINDSKATNAEAAKWAIQAYRFIYWILGGEDKTDGIDPLTPFLSAIQHAFLIGRAAERFAATLQEHGISYTLSGTLDQAVQQAYRAAQSDDLEGAVVLLSPACASFDQFRDFEARGDYFRSCVQKLVNHPSNTIL